MSGEDLSLTVGFDVNEAELERAFETHVQELGRDFEGVQSSAKALLSDISDLVGPMTKVRDLAKELAASFKEAKEAAASIRSDVSSTRLATGLGVQGAGAGASGGLGGLGGILSGGMGALIGGAAIGGLGFGVLSGGTWARSWNATFGDNNGGNGGFMSNLSGLLRGGFSGATGDFASEGERQRLSRMLDQGGFAAPLQAYGQGFSATQIMSQARPEQLAGAYGMTRGFISGMGQGPVGLASQVIGGAYGASGGLGLGRVLSEQMGLDPTAGMLAGAETGRQYISGMTNRYITEGMQRLPGALASLAAEAQPRLYGATRQSMRGMQPGRWGFGPEQWGAELSGLYQGFGGGDLSRDTVRTSMAYSRAYGVSMGQIGQSVGGLINAGGGGQMATEQQREEVTLRIMADAISTGFGRRLPEFAQAVSSGVGVVLSGPSIVRQADMQDLIGSISRTTGAVSREHGIGLAGAGRMIAPIAGATGGMLRNLMQGGGDPYATAMIWQHGRERFGNDPYAMMQGLASVQGDPLGEDALRFLTPSIQTILQSTPTRFGQAAGLQRLFSGLGQDMSFENIDQIVTRGSGALTQARAEGRDMTEREMLDALLGIDSTEQDEAEEMRTTMRDIQESGEAIMREQLGALSALAGYQRAELGVSTAMMKDAQRFHAAQVAETRAMANMMRVSTLGSAIRSIATLREEGATTFLGTGDVQGYLTHMARGLYGQIRGLGVDSLRADEAGVMEEMRRHRTDPLAVDRGTSPAAGAASTTAWRRGAATGSARLRRGAELVDPALRALAGGQ